jgi:hypothetical protein
MLLQKITHYNLSHYRYHLVIQNIQQSGTYLILCDLDQQNLLCPRQGTGIMLLIGSLELFLLCILTLYRRSADSFI